MLVADENKTFNKGETKLIKVKKVNIPPDTIAMPCFYSRHAIGFVGSIMSSGVPKPVEKGRVIDHVVFTAVADGKVMVGDLIGVINLFPVMLARYAVPPKEIG